MNGTTSSQLPGYDALLPGYGALDALLGWIERHEQLLTVQLLQRHSSAEPGANAIVLSRSSDGDYRVRRCEGDSVACMVWREHLRCRPLFGQAYAEAAAGSLVGAHLRQGFHVAFSARRDGEVEAGIGAAESPMLLTGAA